MRRLDDEGRERDPQPGTERRVKYSKALFFGVPFFVKNELTNSIIFFALDFAWARSRQAASL
jgi:hypothetical protein